MYCRVFRPVEMKELNAVEKELLRLLRLKFSDNDGKSDAVEVRTFHTYRMGPKSGPQSDHDHILSNLNRFKKISLKDALVNLQLNGY